MRARVQGIVALTVVASVAAIYAKSTSGYFFDDDFHWLAQTQSFRPANMLDLSRYDHFYRPVIETYFFVGLSLFGCSPFPFHVASLVIHLLTTFVVYQFARAVSGWPTFAALTALLFAVQPGMTEAVTWIAAITDQLPVLWYVVTLSLHVHALRRRAPVWYGLSLVSFVLCHLTHESAATLLPMMLLVEFTFIADGNLGARSRAVRQHWRRYAPFAVLLLAYLVLAYVVNTRSYLVREGHYMFGVHAIPNILNYIVWLYVGKRAPLDYIALLSALVAVLVWGTGQMRFAVAWIVVTLVPVSFFTWGNAPRYLYLPAVGFAMLLADLILAGERLLTRRWSPRVARVAIVVAVAIVTVRFAVFAKKAADSFPARAIAYQSFVTELRRANPGAVAGQTLVIDAKFLEGVPEIYREPAAQVGLCLPNVRLQLQ